MRGYGLSVKAINTVMKMEMEQDGNHDVRATADDLVEI